MPGQLLAVCSIELTFQKRMRRACHIAYTQNIVPRVVDDDIAHVEAINSVVRIRNIARLGAVGRQLAPSARKRYP